MCVCGCQSLCESVSLGKRFKGVAAQQCASVCPVVSIGRLLRCVTHSLTTLWACWGDVRVE